MSSAARPELSIVIPAYNEEDRIGGVLKKYANFHPNYEIIVVCNGCTDATPTIAEEFAEKDQRIRVLIFNERLGKGGAIREGFKAARGELLGFLDADESVEATGYLKLVRAIENSNADGAIASRRVKGANILVQQSLTRRIASRCFNLLVRYMFDLEFLDTQCGAKIFKAESIMNIKSDMASVGYEFDVELLWRLRSKGFLIQEVPIDWKHSRASKFSLANTPGMLASLIRMRLKGSS